MYNSRNKIDLIIEVWEALDCETVGASEIAAIETAVRERFGKQAVESPMIIARILADEGADLRHSEIMELYLERASDVPYAAEFRNILNFDDFDKALVTIRNLENLRRKFDKEKDKEGLRLLREKAKDAKRTLLSAKANRTEKLTHREIAEWLTMWLQSPELFDNWITLRRKSEKFMAEFGKI